MRLGELLKWRKRESNNAPEARILTEFEFERVLKGHASSLRVMEKDKSARVVRDRSAGNEDTNVWRLKWGFDGDFHKEVAVFEYRSGVVLISFTKKRGFLDDRCLDFSQLNGKERTEPITTSEKIELAIQQAEPYEFIPQQDSSRK